MRAHFRVMFGPWCHHPDRDALPPAAAPHGRDPYQLLVDALDALVASGAIPAESRPGAEISAWAGVHGLASILVEQALPLGPAERAQAFAVLGRTLLLGLGCSPSLAGPPPTPPPTVPGTGVGTPRRSRARGCPAALGA